LEVRLAAAVNTMVIESLGATVERCPSSWSSQLKALVERHVKENGATFLHPFDDRDLIAGHAS
jgi:threonine dehydratase